jgi:CubicO group peptidase (beta-lactamase class C family)
MIRKLLFLVIAILLLTSCHVVRFFVWNFADIHDNKKFASVPVEKGSTTFSFTTSTNNPSLHLPSKITLHGKDYTMEDIMHKTKTVAFLVIRNDSMLLEKYYSGYSNSTAIPSFSAAKAFVSALVGIAIHEGYIKSVDEPITNYLPELDKEKFGRIKIIDLLNMRSGIKFNEGYVNPFGEVAKFYYGTNIKRYVKKLKIEMEPDKEFNYISVNTQLLGMIVANATHRPLHQYLQEKIWTKLGMEYDASWSIDSKKHQTEKAFCCINARARDFAKFGRLYLNKGNWNGEQIVPEEWVEASEDVSSGKNNYIYSYQWWHNVTYEPLTDTSTRKAPYRIVEIPVQGEKNKTMKVIVRPANDFYALGLLGQYIYVNPAKKIVIVRMGKAEGGVQWSELCRQIALNN